MSHKPSHWRWLSSGRSLVGYSRLVASTRKTTRALNWNQESIFNLHFLPRARGKAPHVSVIYLEIFYGNMKPWILSRIRFHAQIFSSKQVRKKVIRSRTLKKETLISCERTSCDRIAEKKKKKNRHMFQYEEFSRNKTQCFPPQQNPALKFNQ